MTDSILRVIIDSSGAQAGAQAVNSALGSITGTATQSLQALNAFTNNLANKLNSLSSNVSFSGILSGFQSMISSMNTAMNKFSSGFFSAFSGTRSSMLTLGRQAGKAFNDGLDSALSGVKDILFKVFSLDAIKSFMQHIATVGTDVQRFKVVIEGIKGSNAIAEQSFKDVMSTADGYGLQVQSLMQPYSRLIAATNETALSGQQVQTMFKGIAAAASTYHLSAQEVNLVMLAFNQMISKGTVSMEELRRQLGERIPGAFEMSAKMIGITTAELEKLVKAGKIKGAEFAAALGDTFYNKFDPIAQKVSTTFFGAMNKMHNAVMRFFNTLATSGVLDTFTTAIETLTNMLNTSESGARKFGAAISDIVNVFITWLKSVSVDDVSNFFKAIANGMSAVTTSLKWIAENKGWLVPTLAFIYGAKSTAAIGGVVGGLIGGPAGVAIGAGIGALAGGTAAAGGAAYAMNSFSSTDKGLTRLATGKIRQEDVFTDDQYVSVKSLKKITLNDMLKPATPKKGLTDEQKSFRRSESIYESYQKQVRDFMLSIEPRKAISDVPTIDQERIEFSTKALNAFNDQMNKLKDQRRDGMISQKDYNNGESILVDTFKNQLVEIENVVNARNELRRSEAADTTKTIIKGFDDKSFKIFDDLNTLLNPTALDQYQKKVYELSETIKGNFLESQKMLTDQMNSGKLLPEEFAKAMDLLTKSYGRQIVTIKDLVEQKKLLDQDPLAGFLSGLKKFSEDSKTPFQMFEDFGVSVFGKMESALSEFVATGKLDFASLARSIIADLIQIQIKMLLIKAMNMFSGTQAAAPVADAALKIIGSANGNVFNSPSLSQYSNGVYHTPKTFMFASGAGIFAEAGPEAVMPLSRDSSGRLGVKNNDAQKESQRPESKGYRIINVIDPNMVKDYMSSSSGEQVVMNMISRNSGRIKQLIGG